MHTVRTSEGIQYDVSLGLRSLSAHAFEQGEDQRAVWSYFVPFRPDGRHVRRRGRLPGGGAAAAGSGPPAGGGPHLGRRREETRAPQPPPAPVPTSPAPPPPGPPPP